MRVSEVKNYENHGDRSSSRNSDFSLFIVGSQAPLLQKAIAPHSSILAWKLPWTEEPGGLQSMGS